MTAPQKQNLFTPEPHYVPGYELHPCSEAGGAGSASSQGTPSAGPWGGGEARRLKGQESSAQAYPPCWWRYVPHQVGSPAAGRGCKHADARSPVLHTLKTSVGRKLTVQAASPSSPRRKTQPSPLGSTHAHPGAPAEV